jgi:acetolactate synthase-1/2/3 large subunit
MILESRETKSGTDFKAWREELNEQKVKYPLTFNTSGEEILLQYAIQVLELHSVTTVVITGAA